jgi:peptide deformylase
MPHRPFIPWPAKVLRTPAAEVTEITDDIRALWDEMINEIGRAHV